MRVTCPDCGAHGSIGLFCSDADARYAVDLASKLPAQLGPLVLQYLGLFRPAKRVLTWTRTRKLLDELLLSINAGVIRRHGRDWPVSADIWRQGIESMLTSRDKLTLPLKSHGYLLEVVCSGANRSEAEQEKHGENLRQARSVKQVDRSEGQSMAALVIRSYVEGENKRRKLFNQPPMSEAEEAEFIKHI